MTTVVSTIAKWPTYQTPFMPKFQHPTVSCLVEVGWLFTHCTGTDGKAIALNNYNKNEGVNYCVESQTKTFFRCENLLYRYNFILHVCMYMYM